MGQGYCDQKDSTCADDSAQPENGSQVIIPIMEHESLNVVTPLVSRLSAPTKGFEADEFMTIPVTGQFSSLSLHPNHLKPVIEL